MRSWLLMLSLLGLGCGPALAASAVCPGAFGANNFAHAPDASGTGCNVVITINANSTVTVTVTDASPYDLAFGGEDALIGVVNNSSTPVSSLNLSGADIFGFDGDGICMYTFVGNGYCTGHTSDPQDYQGPTSTFTITNSNAGVVHFSPAVPAGGGTTYFSLENTPSASLAASVGPTTSPAAVPALSTRGIILLAVLLMGLSALMIRRGYRAQN